MRDEVVVITGASAGIGAALAERVGMLGARPVLVARREPELRSVAARCGPHAHAVVADVTERAQVQRVVDEAVARFGRIDVWVNNAGQGITRMPTALTDEDLDLMMNVNLKSVLYGVQAVLPVFRSQGSGHVINVSSLLGRAPLAPFRSAYVAAKHALNGLTGCLRMELASTDPGIAVSTVHPGVVATEFGLRARHGGVDSRTLPGAQSAEEVAEVIVSVIESRRADVYTRPGYKDMIAGYYTAPDMAEVEAALASGGPPRPR